MAFQSLTRTSLELLNQNYRSPGIAPGAVPPARGQAAAPSDARYKVADEFIRVIPFVEVDLEGRAPARQYQVRLMGLLDEPPFTARAGGTPWQTGASVAFGQELDITGARFKKISTVVRADELMVTGAVEDMLSAQADLAAVAVVRALSEAVFGSLPASDDQAELAGLPYFLGAGSPQDVLYDPARGMLGGVAEILARCHPSDGDLGTTADVVVTSSRGAWRLCRELESKGIAPDFRFCALTGKRQLHVYGVPVLGGRVPEPAGGAAPLSEAWALKIGGPSAVRVLHVGGDADEFGVRREPVTTMTTIDGTGEASAATRGLEVFGVYSLLVPEPESIARLRGVPAGDPFTQP